MGNNTNVFKTVFQTSPIDTAFNQVFDYGYSYDFRDEFTSSLAAGSVNSSSCEPGPGTRTVIDTETCLSILPNVGSSLANQTGVTFGGSNNRCSYADNYAWLDFPTGFNAAAHAGLGRIVVMYDSAGRAAWGYLGAAGSGETLGSDIVNLTFDDSSWSGSDPNKTITGWSSNSANATNYFTNTGASNQCKMVQVDTTCYLNKTSIATSGRLYKVAVDIVSVVGNGIEIRMGVATSGGGPAYTTTGASQTKYWVQGSGTYLTITRNSSGATVVFDNLIITPINAPSSTGALIYKNSSLTTNGWNKPSAFNMNDTAYTFNIYQPASGGKLFFMGGKATAANGDPMLLIKTITRSPGIIGSTTRTVLNTAKNAGGSGWGPVGGSGTKIGMRFSGSVISVRTPTYFCSVDTYTLGARSWAVITRLYGGYWFVKNATTGKWILVWSSVEDNTSALAFCLDNYDAAYYADSVRIPKTRWLPTPLLSDGFTAANSTSNDGRLSDGAGHAETSGLGSGGSGVSCTVVSGTSVIASNKATFSALTSSVGMAVYQTNNANITIKCALTRSSGNVGIVLRYVDPDNYVRAIHTGTNVQLIKRVAGSEVTSINTAIAYSADSEMMVRADSTKYSVWYNNTLAGSLETEIADSAIQSSGKCGIYTSDTGATFDNLVVYPTGTGGEYSILDRLIGS